MHTKGEIISKIRNDNKFLSKDNKLSDRWILSKAQDVARRLIKQNGNLVKIYKSDEIFQYIPCVELQQVDLSECCSVKVGQYISRSIERLPEIETGIYGFLVQRVTTIFGNDLNKTTPRGYEDIISIKYANNKIYYWIRDGYLYISSPEIEKVSVSAFFKDYTADEGDCVEPYDQKFLCPDWLIGEMSEILKSEFQSLHTFRGDAGVDNIDKSR